MSKIVKMRGLAQSTLDRLRDRRTEVKLRLSSKAIGLLNSLLREPIRLSAACQQAGLISGPGAANHYKASSPDQATKIYSLRKNWLEAKVMTKKGDSFEWSEETKEYPLAKAYVKLLQEILQHYQPVGMLIEYAEIYLDLKYALEGKELSAELEESGDIAGADGVVEKLSELEEEKAKKEA